MASDSRPAPPATHAARAPVARTSPPVADASSGDCRRAAQIGVCTAFPRFHNPPAFNCGRAHVTARAVSACIALETRGSPRASKAIGGRSRSPSCGTGSLPPGGHPSPSTLQAQAALAANAAGWATVIGAASAGIPTLVKSAAAIFESGIPPPVWRIVEVPDRESVVAHGRERVVRVRVPIAA